MKLSHAYSSLGVALLACLWAFTTWWQMLVLVVLLAALLVVQGLCLRAGTHDYIKELNNSAREIVVESKRRIELLEGAVDLRNKLLQSAQNGLAWYRDEHPEDDSQADDEMHAAIEAALKEKL